MNINEIRHQKFAWAALAALFFLACVGTETSPSATLVLTNGSIYTVNPEQPWAEAIAVQDGEIVRVGSVAEVSALVGGGTRVVDLEGGFVLPGLHDAHIHATGDQLRKRGLYLGMDDPVETVLAKVRAYAESRPELPIITGVGWGRSVTPDKALLDAIDAARPMLLGSNGGHSVWVNTAALRRAGVTAETANPPGGLIDRDPATGEPTGLFLDAAMELFTPLREEAREADRPTEADYDEAARTIGARLNSFGVTSIKEGAAGRPILATYDRLAERGELNLRVAVATHFDPVGSEEEQTAARQTLEEREAYRSTLVNPDFAKIFIDGIPGTMILLKPHPANESIFRVPQEELDAIVTELDAKGVSVMMHANGDGAVRSALDAVEAARKANGNTGVPHHVAHTALVDDDDLDRFADLDVVAENSPFVWFPNPVMDFVTGVLGSEIIERAYPARKLIDAGAKYVMASDWESDNPEINPLPFVEAAVTRRNPFGAQEGTLGAASAIQLEEAIRAITTNAAYLMRQSDRVGSLESGKLADLVVLDRNLFEIPVDEISEAEVVMTLFDGRIVYERSDSADPTEQGS